MSLMACAILVVDQTALKKYKNLPFALTLITLVVVSIIFAGNLYQETTVVMEGMFIDDSFSNLTKLVICLISLLVFAHARAYSKARDIAGSEFYVLGLFGVLGMMVMASGPSARRLPWA